MSYVEGLSFKAFAHNSTTTEIAEDIYAVGRIMETVSYTKRELPLQVGVIGLKMLHPRIHCRPSLEQVEVWLQDLITTRADGYRGKDGLRDQIMGQGGSTASKSRWPRWRWLLKIVIGVVFLSSMTFSVFAIYTVETHCLKNQAKLLELYEGSFTLTKVQNSILGDVGLGWLKAPLPNPPTLVCHTPLHEAVNWGRGLVNLA
ncbi:hypothetical protein Hamer_G031460 [Homarus americanus]|uniref:Uncharacterized protein n=2 Tax=Homarus americanus TaxID=6706 RepID=A0A8J5K1M6_HOMAM|nr:hypothetical protein Hamer_G031460 [Homarus americanus]